MSCVVRNTVAPRSFSLRMTSRMASDEVGSSPAVGSSRNRICGLFTKDLATIRRCFMPLEYVSTLSLPRPSSPTRLRNSDASKGLTPKSRANRLRFSMAVICSYKLVVSKHTPIFPCTFSIFLATSIPSNTARPPLGFICPVSILTVVVFPAPFGPRNPRISPSAT